MSHIPGSVPVTGFIAPTDSTDTYATIDPLYGIDGLRSVADHDVRDAIPAGLRREGMLVYTRSDGSYWQMGSDLASWTTAAFGGSQGTQGVQGRQGVQGYQGFQGVQGVQGATGVQGNQGYQGTQGLTGAGTQGVQGVQGYQGNQGFQGLTGTGTQGVQGRQGVQGVQGTGAQGDQGTIGALGFQGNQGLQGYQGVTGSGTQGSQGVAGAQGVAGGGGGGGISIGSAVGSGTVGRILYEGSNAGSPVVADNGSLTYANGGVVVQSDATNSPFQVQTGSSQPLLYVGTAGKVGVLTSSPQSQVDVTTGGVEAIGQILRGHADGVATVTGVEVTSNVAKITTLASHGFLTGATVILTGLSHLPSATYTIAGVPTATTFTYALTHANVSFISDSGSARVRQYGDLLRALDTSGSVVLAVGPQGHLSTVAGVTYVWPTSQGVAGTLLGNNGSGTLSWTGVPAAGTNAQPDFTSHQIQYNDNGTLGVGNLSWDSASNQLTIDGDGGINPGALSLSARFYVGYNGTLGSPLWILNSNGSGSSTTFMGAANQSGLCEHFFSASQNLTVGTYPAFANIGQGSLANAVKIFGANRHVLVGSMGLSQADVGGQLGVITASASTIGFVCRIDASHTASALEVQDSLGTTLLGVDKDGGLATVRGVAYTWPSSQGGASTVLSNNGSGALSWASGVTGPQGSTGAQGTTGATGSQGSQGRQGTTGAGIQGAQGIQGATGSTGSAGSTGGTGPQGTQGLQGAVGSTGSQGTTGATGAQGTQGNQGSAGAAGAQGTQGRQGSQGFQGFTGATGNQGLVGNQGNQGFQGAAGSATVFAAGSQYQVQYNNGPQGSQFGSSQYFTYRDSGMQLFVGDPTSVVGGGNIVVGAFGKYCFGSQSGTRYIDEFFGIRVHGPQNGLSVEAGLALGQFDGGVLPGGINSVLNDSTGFQPALSVHNTRVQNGDYIKIVDKDNTKVFWVGHLGEFGIGSVTHDPFSVGSDGAITINNGDSTNAFAVTAAGNVTCEGYLEVNNSTSTVHKFNRDGTITLNTVDYTPPSGQGGPDTFLRNDGDGGLYWGGGAPLNLADEPAIVSGSRGDGSALASLLRALSERGIIEDRTL